jgi:hypothetical protein
VVNNRHLCRSRSVSPIDQLEWKLEEMVALLDCGKGWVVIQCVEEELGGH